jgi:dihydrolipoamide dehydrogenase
VGLEIAQALGRLDVEVFLFADGDTMGGLTDPELVKVLREQLAKDVFYIHQNVTDLKLAADGFHVSTNGSTHTVDGVLLALGRQPNIKNLGLEKLGVRLDNKGLPELNPNSLRIKGTDVYLAGDVSSISPLLHEAVDEGRIAGYNSVRQKDEEFERRTRLAITYSHPGCGVAGKSYAELKKEGIAFKTGEVSFEKQGRAMTQLEGAGRLHVYADPESGKILGTEMFAPAAEHLTHMLAWSIDSKCTVFDLLGKPFYHPTIEEGLRTALRRLAKQLPKSYGDFDLSRCGDMPVAP